jgi:hypothetical protein
MTQEHVSCKNHPHHLCKLTSDGLHKTDPKAYHELVQNPEYVCKSCGRVAAKKDNLCMPAKLGAFEE